MAQMLMQVKSHSCSTGEFISYIWLLFLLFVILIVVHFFNFRLPSNDGNASKGKQQTSEPVHILKRSFARTVSVVSFVIRFKFYFAMLYN